MNRHWIYIFIFLLLYLFGEAHAEIIFPSETDEVLSAYRDWAKNEASPILPQLAQEIVTCLLRHEKPPIKIEIPWIRNPVGLFVTAMRGTKVRACVGTFYPQGRTLSEELLTQCKRLTASDPRHPPLDPQELNELNWVVTLTGKLQPVTDPLVVDLLQQGLSAEWEGREGVLLPGEAKTLKWGLAYLQRQLRAVSVQSPRYSTFPVLVWKEKPGDRQNGR